MAQGILSFIDSIEMFADSESVSYSRVRPDTFPKSNGMRK